MDKYSGAAVTIWSISSFSSSSFWIFLAEVGDIKPSSSFFEVGSDSSSIDKLTYRKHQIYYDFK